jgi:hypothetical protein
VQVGVPHDDTNFENRQPRSSPPPIVVVVVKNAGIDTIRILMPWAAGAEPDDGTFNWGADFVPPKFYSLPSSAGGHAGVPITQAEQLYAAMAANGDGNKKMWATEYGRPSSALSEASRAAFVGDFLRT